MPFISDQNRGPALSYGVRRLSAARVAVAFGTSGFHGLVPRSALVLAEGLSGALTAQRRTRPSVLLIEGGVGITPMRALFESLPTNGGQLTLLHRASTPGDVVFRSELESIARRRGAEIIWMIGPSAQPELAAGGSGSAAGRGSQCRGCPPAERWS